MTWAEMLHAFENEYIYIILQKEPLHGNKQLGHSDVDRRIILKLILQILCLALDLSGSEKGPALDSCEDSNEPLDSIAIIQQSFGRAHITHFRPQTGRHM
jgi:hypothetical protein